MAAIYYDDTDKCWMDAWRTVVAGDVPFIVLSVRHGRVVAKAVTYEQASNQAKKFGSGVEILSREDTGRC